jgi:hypothetical protein
MLCVDRNLQFTTTSALLPSESVVFDTHSKMSRSQLPELQCTPLTFVLRIWLQSRGKMLGDVRVSSVVMLLDEVFTARRQRRMLLASTGSGTQQQAHGQGVVRM